MMLSSTAMACLCGSPVKYRLTRNPRPEGPEWVYLCRACWSQRYAGKTCTCGVGPWDERHVCQDCGGVDHGMPALAGEVAL